MSKIEKPWAAFGTPEKTQYGLITEDRGDVVFIKSREGPLEPSTSWNYEYVERFENVGALADDLYQKLDKLHCDVVRDIKASFPIACKHIDMNGRDLSMPISPLDICEWEDMQVNGEVTGLVVIKDVEDARKQMEELGNIILKFSAEIFRLRLTYGEEVWGAVYHTKEEDNFIRKTHEAERGKHTIKKCPYCSSKNAAIKQTYFDQTCDGCVERMYSNQG